MITLYTHRFSPFARKIALCLELKGLPYETVDGLAHENLDALRRVNPRAEVPVLVDREVIVANSADIAWYLEQRYPEPPLYPAHIEDRVKARTLERLSDTRLDAILVGCSLWTWAKRPDKMPLGLHEAGQRDLNQLFTTLEEALEGTEGPAMFGAPGIVEAALFPQLKSVRALGFKLDEGAYPRLVAWLAALSCERIFRNDAKRTAEFLSKSHDGRHERVKIAWRGDRIEWILKSGFHAWFWGEIEGGRVIWPA